MLSASSEMLSASSKNLAFLHKKVTSLTKCNIIRFRTKVDAIATFGKMSYRAPKTGFIFLKIFFDMNSL